MNSRLVVPSLLRQQVLFTCRGHRSASLTPSLGSEWRHNTYRMRAELPQLCQGGEAWLQLADRDSYTLAISGKTLGLGVHGFHDGFD